MAIYLKQFSTHSEYDTYINGSDAILPNVSICTTEGDVHYNPSTPPTPPTETRVVAKFNVTDTSRPTPISYYNEDYDDDDYYVTAGTSGFSSIEIDGVEQPSVVSAYTFGTTGEHTVKYTLKDLSIITNYAFFNCTSLTSITIPNSVASIGNNTFNGCAGLTSVTIPDSVTSISKSAFSSCSGLTSIVVGGSNTTYDSRDNCNAVIETATNKLIVGCKNTVIPNNVTSIAEYAFSGCFSLTSVDIPNSVTSIGGYAFTNCTSLTSCTIGSGVTSIGSNAFYGCSSLTSITSNAIAAPTIQSNTFRNIKTNGTLYVPIGSSGYDVWMGSGNYYLGKYNWTKV